MVAPGLHRRERVPSGGGVAPGYYDTIQKSHTDDLMVYLEENARFVGVFVMLW